MASKKKKVDSGDARLDDEKGEQAITKQARERAFAEDDANRCECHNLLPGLCPTKWMRK
jgi:hypothetical protein